MLLIDILVKVGDGTIVRVFDNECEEIAKYDGKDSIPEELNNKEIETVFPAAFGQLNVILV